MSPTPLLLREASYNLFKSPLWHASDKEFRSVLPETNETTWILLPEKSPRRSVTISRFLERGLGLLALPNGSSQLEGLPVFLLSVNSYGALKVGAGPGLVSYLTRYDEGETVDLPPTREDLEIPTAEKAALSQIARELDLAAPPPEEVVRSLRAFFQNRFQYASYLAAPGPALSNQTALARFLLQTRAGHCEYFATATTLLLRQAGIPARYAVGYSVQEAAGKKHVVRERHGHAWCLVYLGGQWRDLDTTPGSWNALEAKHASFWEPLSYLGSRVWFEFSKWRWSRAGVRQYILWFVLALLLVAAARLFFKKQWRQFQETWRRPSPSPGPGLDSEIYLIERHLRRKGIERQPGETLSAWLNRLRVPKAPGLDSLAGILQLHYRYRFDPAGLSQPERADLATRARHWLETNPR